MRATDNIEPRKFSLSNAEIRYLIDRGNVRLENRDNELDLNFSIWMIILFAVPTFFLRWPSPSLHSSPGSLSNFHKPFLDTLVKSQPALEMTSQRCHLNNPPPQMQFRDEFKM